MKKYKMKNLNPNYTFHCVYEHNLPIETIKNSYFALKSSICGKWVYYPFEECIKIKSFKMWKILTSLGFKITERLLHSCCILAIAKNTIEIFEDIVKNYTIKEDIIQYAFKCNRLEIIQLIIKICLIMMY